MSSLPTRQRGVTEFQPKELCSPLSLTDEGWTNNPNITTSGYKMKFWSLLPMIAHIANTTQQNHKDIKTNHNVPSKRKLILNPSGPRTSLQLKS